MIFEMYLKRLFINIHRTFAAFCRGSSVSQSVSTCTEYIAQAIFHISVSPALKAQHFQNKKNNFQPS